MEHFDAILVLSVFSILLLAEYLTGISRGQRRNAGEWLIESISFLQLAVIKPAVLFIAFLVTQLLFPGSQNSLAELPFWLGFLVVFLPDDFSHYWIHRLAHQQPRIWGLHRTHHTPNVYQASIAFRENWLWFWIMPGFWWAGVMVYFGLLPQVLLSAAVIGIHNVVLHTGFTADRSLYRNKYLKRFVRSFEYLINTPSLHRGHHGLGTNGVPAGNFAQTLFVWDVIFGTAVFQDDRIPQRYGTVSLVSMTQPWYYQLWWPLVKQRQPKSTS
jgi:sterol desaturase/sphingolipid hydroxylase (fatty acid hydroxylase superfamily)